MKIRNGEGADTWKRLLVKRGQEVEKRAEILWQDYTWK